MLVSEPVDVWLRAVMSGVLDPGYLRLRDGNWCRVVLLQQDATVVATSMGPVVRMSGSECRVGDRARSGGQPSTATWCPPDQA